MYKSALLFIFLCATQVPAAASVRCGTDAFGNAVCMDKDGVVSSAPKGAAGDLKGTEAQSGAASAGTESESIDKTGRDGKDDRPRCGVDPFGNTVCR